MYKKNKLKDLIYIQENKPCNEQTIKGLFRSIVEPILEQLSPSLILCRLEDKSKREFNGIIKRLKYSNAKVYDFSDSPLENVENVLKEKIWDKTEFVYVLTDRFGAVLIFDYSESELKDFAQVYILHNSKNLSDAFDIINENSTVDLNEYQEKFKPDRRDNDVLNSSIRKIIENLNETNQEVLISQLEKETAQEVGDAASRLDFILTKSSYIAHEMRNLLSICNLYSTIIEKQEHKMTFENKDVEKSIKNARDCIRKSMKMAGNLLLDFKSMNNINLKVYDFNEMVNSGIELAQIYSSNKNIKFTKEIGQTTEILVDETNFLTVLINLIKNAVENIEEKGEITIKTEVLEENAKLTISNTGKPISPEVQERVFEEGFTTKATGSGLGLAICRKTLEEQFAQLNLIKSDETSTVFEVTVLKG